VQVGAYVRQLAAYGDSQASALEPVSAQRILQDLAPVLKRLVGDRVELTLSKSSGFFPVDVSAERLERILVNVAGYARQRMSAGGLMRIDLATTAVGRRFVARHPHVRPGDHVLITVTELPHSGGVAIADPNAQCRDQAGVDLAALVELIGTCGGHLWMEAQPAGNIVVKIHLPKRAPAGHTRTDRGGRLARWFRSASPTAMRA
jgi:two-component system cell cycle sensor histidine kinase/response regulator CckA